MDDATGNTEGGRHLDDEHRDSSGAAPEGDEQAVEEVAEALPGSGKLEVSDDDLDGASGPIQLS